MSWKLVAKDGQDLPSWQQVITPARVRLGAGETVDVAFTPLRPGRLTLEISSFYGTTLVTREDVIVH